MVNRNRNRRQIIRIIKKKARESGVRADMDEAPWESNIAKLEYLQFLRDLEEGRIRHLGGKKIG